MLILVVAQRIDIALCATVVLEEGDVSSLGHRRFRMQSRIASLMSSGKLMDAYSDGQQVIAGHLRPDIP
jgi:hypothetical protein